MSFKGINYGRIAEDSSQFKLVTINNSTINKNDIIVETASDEVGN